MIIQKSVFILNLVATKNAFKRVTFLLKGKKKKTKSVKLYTSIDIAKISSQFNIYYIQLDRNEKFNFFFCNFDRSNLWVLSLFLVFPCYKFRRVMGFYEGSNG